MKRITVIKAVLFAAALIPAAALAYGFYQVYTGADPNALTPNPGDYITDQTGTWTLALLVISLVITPLRRLTHWNEVIKVRRMLGLFAFFYATLHLLTWVWLIHLFDPVEMIKDVAERRFITIGMATWLILFALALTSNTFAIRRLGRRWQSLHRLVYAAAIGGVIHYWWLVKADITLPRRWAVAVAVLLGARLWWMWEKRQRHSFHKEGKLAG
ncbi:MAG TPA: protein-methionine-sulfoxide reductase heme-binding subunit MsrQ [Vicinamibacterales bacterium]|nr:protein-methionine-sulfoxide reductase heme-binding subunit MsrQ [Vicinamibacterales bacterium]